MHFSMTAAKQGTDSFATGALHKMAALCAFGMPNFDSYVRVAHDKAGVWISFGTENRDLPVRKITDEHWEFRFADSMASFYLFMAAVFAAGSAGINNDNPLMWKDCSVSPRKLSAAELAAFGIVERMPRSLRLSLDAATRDNDMESWIGRELLAQYLAAKEKEAEVFGKMTDEERRKKFLSFF